MTQILQFLVAHCSFLWAGARFRIVDSLVATSQGGDAWLLVASDDVRLRFVRDRGQLFLDVQGTAQDDDAWFSLDLLWRLILHEPRDSAELDGDYAAFLQAHLAGIEGLFSDRAAWPTTRRELQRLKRVRAREMFG